MSKLPCKYYQLGCCLRPNCRFLHGDSNLGARRVSPDRYNTQNKHDLQKRANIGDKFSPHLLSTRKNTRLEVDYRGLKHSSLQDNHGYEDVRDSSIAAYRRNRRERSRSREVRERCSDARCRSPRRQSNKRDRDISTHEKSQTLNLPSSSIVDERYEEGEITEDLYASSDVKVKDCKTDANKVSDASIYNLLPLANETIVQRANNHKKNSEVKNHTRKLDEEENDVVKEDQLKRNERRSPTANKEAKNGFTSGSDSSLLSTSASCLCKHALPNIPLSSLKDIIAERNHQVSINVFTSKIDFKVEESASTVFSEIEHTGREPCSGCEKVEDFIAQAENTITTMQRDISTYRALFVEARCSRFHETVNPKP